MPELPILPLAGFTPKPSDPKSNPKVWTDAERNLFLYEIQSEKQNLLKQIENFSQKIKSNQDIVLHNQLKSITDDYKRKLQLSIGEIDSVLSQQGSVDHETRYIRQQQGAAQLISVFIPEQRADALALPMENPYTQQWQALYQDLRQIIKRDVKELTSFLGENWSHTFY